MSSTLTTMLPSIGEDEIFGAAEAESASVRILPATPAQIVPASSSSPSSNGAIKTYISVYNGEVVAVPCMVCIFLG